MNLITADSPESRFRSESGRPTIYSRRFKITYRSIHGIAFHRAGTLISLILQPLITSTHLFVWRTLSAVDGFLSV